MLACCREGGGGCIVAGKTGGQRQLEGGSPDIHMIASFRGTAPNIGLHFRDIGKYPNAVIFLIACINFYNNYCRMDHQIRQYEGNIMPPAAVSAALCSKKRMVKQIFSEAMKLCFQSPSILC